MPGQPATGDRSLTTPPPSAERRDPPKFNSYPWWAVRIWSGMRFPHFWRMMRRHAFRVDPQRWAMALIIGQMTPWNSALYGLNQLWHRRRIRETVVDKPPVFIIGHWRSGTTHLHELLIRDSQFGYATTYQCFAPWHFLVSEWILARLLGFLLPAKRPMDNMATGMDRPQEDEFGLAVMGAPSMYYRMGFPNDPAEHLDTLNMNNVSAQDRRAMMDAINYFYKALTAKHQKRLLLKSPPHTGRIRFLSKMYPGAKFVHISRHPYAVFPSMQRCWQALYEAQGFQIRTEYGPEFDEFVHRTYEAMYDDYDLQTAELAPENYCDIRYEKLAADPVASLKAIYQQLELDGYDQMLPELEKYLETQKDYQPNQLSLPPERKAEIDDRWGWYFERFGYEKR